MFTFHFSHAEKLTTQEAEFDLQVEQLKVHYQSIIFKFILFIILKKTKQKEELAELKEKSKKEGTKPKFSSELLRLRKQQETLAKMEKYPSLLFSLSLSHSHSTLTLISLSSLSSFSLPSALLLSISLPPVLLSFLSLIYSPLL